jgi:hypothetical protein
VANAAGVSRERVASSCGKPSPARASRGHPLPQAGEGKARAGEFANINVDPNSEPFDDDDAAFQEYLKTLPKAEAQALFQARVTRQYEQQRRLVNNVFQFWLVCQDGACERNACCAGDPYACHQRWWPWTPERQKARYRAYVKARADGGAHSEALAFAETEVKRLADHIARVEAEQHARLDALAAAERAQCGEAAEPAQRADAAIPAREPPPPRERRREPRVRVL